MIRRRLAVAAAAAIALACSAARADPSVAPSALEHLPSYDECVGAPDRDLDGLADACEYALARAFAPLLLQSPEDCGFDSTAGRIRGGYMHATQGIDAGRVRIAYLPAYLTDCGWTGPKCLLPGVDCSPHAADSEFIVVEAVHDARAGWRVEGVFLSAHCFDGDAPACRWWRGGELHELDWTGSHPIVRVADGRHANYPDRAACDRGHHFLDSCDLDPASVTFPVDDGRDIGSAAAPRCIANSGSSPSGSAETECPWTDSAFAAWQEGVRGSTGYRRYLDEVAGLIEPIERLAWLAGCWAGGRADSFVEERWMAPRGGTMLGMGRVVRGRETIAHETMRIEQRADTLVFVAQPSGQPQAEFIAVTVTDSAVVFGNPAHDFPQRITYRHAAGDSLHAQIAGRSDGVDLSVDFRMGRTECTR